MTYGEIRLGIEKLPAGKRRSDLERWLETGLPAWFAANLLPITRQIVARWASMTVIAAQSGSPLPTADGFIAATAWVHGLTLVTRNTKHFQDLGISTLNPWEMQL